jgi:hypothetical protein
MKTKVQLICVALFLLGLAFVFNALTTYLKNQGVLSKFEQTKAIVINIGKMADSTTYPIVQFKTIDNQRVRVSLMQEKISKFAKGDTLMLYYDLINPQSIYIPSIRKNLSFGIIGFIGALMCVPAILFFTTQFRSKQRIKQMKAEGKKIIATITQIEPLNTRKFLGITPYIIHCEGSTGSLNGKIQKFRSGMIWADPQEYLSDNQIAVYISSISTENYVVDLSFLPTEVGLYG